MPGRSVMSTPGLCILQSVTSGDEWSVESSCRKVETVVGSGASSIKSATDIGLIADVLQQCLQLLSTHDQARIILRRI